MQFRTIDNCVVALYDLFQNFLTNQTKLYRVLYPNHLRSAQMTDEADFDNYKLLITLIISNEVVIGSTIHYEMVLN